MNMELERLARSITEQLPEISDLIGRDYAVSTKVTDAGNATFVFASQKRENCWIRVTIARKIFRDMFEDSE